VSGAAKAPSLALQGLRYRYRDGTAMAFPDVKLANNQHLLLLGPSGSGKSTLLALMAGLLTPSAGQVLMAGTDVGALGAAARDAWRGRHLGFVPQRLHLSSALCVLDNLRLPFVCAGLACDEARLAELQSALGIDALAQRRPHELSVGQAQRVAIARALVRRPRLLLADEPTASLDDAAAAAVLDLLMQASAGQGASLVVATHDSRVVGRLLQSDPAFVELPGMDARIFA